MAATSRTSIVPKTMGLVLLLAMALGAKPVDQLVHDKEKVRLRAAEAINAGEAVELTAADLPVLLQAVRDGDPSVRAAAYSLLQQIETEVPMDHLVDLCGAAYQDLSAIGYSLLAGRDIPNDRAEGLWLQLRQQGYPGN